MKCRICEETKKINKFLTLECSHKFCLSCLQLDWKAKIKDEKNLSPNSITCRKCSKPISYDLLKNNADKSFISKYDEALFVKLCPNDSIISNCPECKCLYVADKTYSYVTCQKCTFKFCLSCKSDWTGHGGLTCKQFKKKTKKEEVEEIEIDEQKLNLKHTRIKKESFH